MNEKIQYRTRPPSIKADKPRGMLVEHEENL